MQDVEESMDGNICRCTGYRPILDGFKAMSGDASEELKRKFPDVTFFMSLMKKFLHNFDSFSR